MRTIVLIVTAALLGASPAFADCRNDLVNLEASLPKHPTGMNQSGAVTEAKKARQTIKLDEVDCRNHVAKAWRLLHTPDEKPRVSPNAPRINPVK